MPRFSHFPTALLALAALGLGIIAWRQHLEIQRLAHATLGVAEKPDARHATPSGRDVVFPKRRAAPVSRGDDMELPPEFGAAAAPGRRPAEAARVLDDAQFLRALAVHQEGSLDLRFAPLFRRLNLAAEELARFKRLLVEKDNAALDVALASRQMGAPLSPQGMQAGIHDAHGEVETAIRQSLGQERYEVYADYMSTLPQRVTVMRLERRLSYTETPLQPSQAETLVTILAQHPAPDKNARATAVIAGMAAETVPTGPSSPPAANISAAAVAQAAVVLLPRQVEALRQIQTELHAAVGAAEYLHRNAPAGTGAGGWSGGTETWIRFLLQ